MKDTRTPTEHSTGVSRQNIEQALMNDQDALRAEAGKLAAEPTTASDATSWFELLYQAFDFLTLTHRTASSVGVVFMHVELSSASRGFGSSLPRMAETRESR